MKTRLSYSSINRYLKCGRSYDLHYNKKYRSIYTSGALVMGSAIDKGLNTLLETKDLGKAILDFDEAFKYTYLNNVKISVPKSINVVYSKNDFDDDLLLLEDKTSYYEYKKELLIDSESSVDQDVKYLQDLKKKSGLDSFSTEEKKLYSYANWLCLRQKGHIMLKSYNKDVLPAIKNVLSVQKEISLENQEGDVISGYIDIIVEWEDGKKYLIDNKTSTRIYENDSALRSHQLITYYASVKDEYKLDGVGFIVLNKSINKNKVKICSKCNFDGSGTKFKTCNNEILEIRRCGEKWVETINPECSIRAYLSVISDKSVNFVMQVNSEVNEGIKSGYFPPNLNSCGSLNSDFCCPFFKHCWGIEDTDLIVLEGKEIRK